MSFPTQLNDKALPGWSVGQMDTVNDVVRRAAREHGDRQFLDVQGDTYSFADIQRESCRLANGLATLGVVKGQTVVTLLDNNADAVLLWFALNKLGAISVPVNTALKGDFLRHQIADATAELVIAEAEYVERIALVQEQLPGLKHIVHRGAAPAADFGGKTLLGLEALRSDDASDPQVEVLPSDLTMLIYTGGTTGPSKGCMISHNNACNEARQIIEAHGRTPDSVTWTPLPLFHLNATVTTILCNLMIGARSVIYPRFSVSGFWADIERSGANEANLLASMGPLLADAPDNEAMKRCYGQLDKVYSAPFPPELQVRWRERFGVRHTVGGAGFGLTECAIVTMLPFGQPDKPNCAGRRCDSFDIRVVDEHDVELPYGTPGELIVRPLKPHVMFEGYWNRPADTLKVMRNMWFHTGDIGKMDEDGFFFFLDRKNDYMRRGGENISGFEMERSFLAHPQIEEVAVHAVFSELSEDEVKVTVVLREGSTLSEEELCRWAIERVPYYVVPRYIEFRNELPRSPVGRILKYRLRDEGVTESTWDRVKANVTFDKR
ncbi:ATP-dependent acyl-CoA ligase [Pseudomonas aeruginosa]|uniref:AMP-binding protein n=1 Tax=Pseudomonas aeruginosa TaxID=287 RepID=UPI00071B2BA7|nr:AMP-binding protein [Pseudomonas aeruginosa]KSQ25033.1 ATP-dependent acyl-CoA ligase [Pseudomonas aeruginosa]MCO1687906.1 ATP-dependent acyl-CoA ligase [Pseudomonas aeruginosa]MCO1778592.1 ATP-dependent acyl-CoA ligase [Pseudomonas aeruginosa]MCO1790099.1 ATP-dependent acyl-CoA ligase [Pseudomonas aeruginosa]MDV6504343.1 ATP-dependent acyl-CoA ligase [Pseudomonas aeruginosa]